MEFYWPRFQSQFVKLSERVQCVRGRHRKGRRQSFKGFRKGMGCRWQWNEPHPLPPDFWQLLFCSQQILLGCFVFLNTKLRSLGPDQQELSLSRRDSAQSLWAWSVSPCEACWSEASERCEGIVQLGGPQTKVSGPILLAASLYGLEESHI